MRRYMLLFPLLGVTGCNDPGFTGVGGVLAVEEGEVAACRLVSHISMEPGVYGPVLAEQGLRYARNKVLEQARQDGANRVVFDRVEPGADVYEVRARAFAC
ncbi:MAG: hypothetical protein KDJ82_09230 [Rhodobacteraceae bacterium]|jgi:hypothetical protein|nr:hypothetical protein [Paracoccaceae bacterium]